MSSLSIRSRNPKSAAPKKGSAQSKTASRRKVTSPAANAKKPTRSVESKAERVTFPRFGGHWIKRLGALPVRG